MHVHRDGLPAVGIDLGAEQPTLELSKGDEVLVGGVVLVDVRGPAELRTPQVSTASQPLEHVREPSPPLPSAAPPPFNRLLLGAFKTTIPELTLILCISRSNNVS